MEARIKERRRQKFATESAVDKSRDAPKYAEDSQAGQNSVRAFSNSQYAGLCSSDHVYAGEVELDTGHFRRGNLLTPTEIEATKPIRRLIND